MRPEDLKHTQDDESFSISSRAVQFAVLAMVTIAAIVVCIMMTVPFLPALAWAMALAIVAFPMHRWIASKCRSRDVAAGLSTALVVLFLVIPSYLVVARLTQEATHAKQVLDEKADEGAIQQHLEGIPLAQSAYDWIVSHVDPEEIRKVFLSRVSDVTGVLEGSVWAGFQMLTMLIVLFYFFRDSDSLMRGVLSLSPLSGHQTNLLSCRVQDSIFATVYGTFVTGALQGGTGGLLFWSLRLPAPVLWGTIMFVLGILPIVGGILVWLPASIYLVMEGRIGAAVLIVLWGSLMAGPIGSFIYARCAGGRMSLHPVPTLIAYLGGLALFGVTGIVLGPVTLALTLGLIDVWKGSTTHAKIVVPSEKTQCEESPLKKSDILAASSN